MEEKLAMIEKLIEDIKTEEEIYKEKTRKRKEEELENWREKVREKDRKEKLKEERLEKQRLLSQRWAMKRWVTQFISDHQEQWDLERKEKEIEAQKELEDWEKMRRLEKIEVLKRKWKKNPQPEKETPKKHEKNENWSIWRKRECGEDLEAENNEIGGGGGSFPKAFPIPNIYSAPVKNLQEGDPPIGKERGALGVGTGPTPLPSSHKRIWSQNLGGAVAFHALMTSLCPQCHF